VFWKSNFSNKFNLETVFSYITNVFKKLKARSRRQVVARRTSFLDLGVVVSSDDDENTDEDGGEEPVSGFIIIAPNYAQVSKVSQTLFSSSLMI